MKKLVIILFSFLFIACSSPDFFEIQNDSSQDVSVVYNFEPTVIYTIQSKKTISIEKKAPIQKFTIDLVDAPYSVQISDTDIQFIKITDKTVNKYRVYNQNSIYDIYIKYTDLDGNETSKVIKKCITDVNYLDISTFDNITSFYYNSEAKVYDASGFTIIEKL